jgi:hypothetical protein
MGLFNHKIAICTQGDDACKIAQLACMHLGASEIFNEEGLKVICTGDGTLLELYSACAPQPRYMFAHNSVMFTLKVTDLRWALATALALGISAVTDIIKVNEAFSYCHLALEDGTVIGLYQDVGQNFRNGPAQL